MIRSCLLAVALAFAKTAHLHAAALQAEPLPAQANQPATPSPSPKPTASLSVPPPSPEPSPRTPPNVDLVLERLQQNVREYYGSIPTFFCSEHVLSESERPGFLNGSVHTVSDSQFRLRRKVGKAKDVTLEESRIVQTINGKPAPAHTDETTDIVGPSLLIGGFSESLKLASALGRACYSYTLEPVRPGHETDPLLLLFTNLPRKSRNANCPPYADIQGRALIDPTLMRVLHIQQTTRNYEIVPGVVGTWTWSVDYSRVLMGGKPFWLPTRTESSSFAQRSPARWRYTATYSSCHKLEVTSTMLPIDETPSKAAPKAEPQIERQTEPQTEPPKGTPLTPHL